MSRRSWQYRTSLALLPVSAALYAWSLFLHFFVVQREFRILGIGKVEQDAYRLFGTIEELWKDGQHTLALIIVAFSFLFPVGKYVALAFVIAARRERARERVLGWVKNLGQWSMGDVFVVAMMVVILRVDNAIAEIGVQPQAGLWVFTASVISAMVVSVLLGFEPRDAAARSEPAGPERTV